MMGVLIPSVSCLRGTHETAPLDQQGEPLPSSARCGGHLPPREGRGCREKRGTPLFIIGSLPYYRLSTSSSQIRALASLGIRQSPRGLRVTEPTFTPSGRQLRLNCWVKNRR